MTDASIGVSYKPKKSKLSYNLSLSVGGLIGLGGLAYLFLKDNPKPPIPVTDIINTRAYQMGVLVIEAFNQFEAQLENHTRVINAIINDFNSRWVGIAEELAPLSEVQFTSVGGSPIHATETKTVSFADDDALLTLVFQKLPQTDHIAIKMDLSSSIRGYNSTLLKSRYFDVPDVIITPIGINQTKAYAVAQGFDDWYPNFESNYSTNLDEAYQAMLDKWFNLARPLADLDQIIFREYNDSGSISVVRSVQFAGDDAVAYLYAQRYDSIHRLGVKVMLDSASRNYSATLFTSPYYNYNPPAPPLPDMQDTDAYLVVRESNAWAQSWANRPYVASSLLAQFKLQTQIRGGNYINSPTSINALHGTSTFSDDDAFAEIYIDLVNGSGESPNPSYRLVAYSLARPRSANNPFVYDMGYVIPPPIIIGFEGTNAALLAQVCRDLYNAGTLMPTSKFDLVLQAAGMLVVGSNGTYWRQGTTYGFKFSFTYRDNSEAVLYVSDFPPGMKISASLYSSDRSTILIRDQTLFESTFFDTSRRQLRETGPRKYVEYLQIMGSTYEGVYKVMSYSQIIADAENFAAPLGGYNYTDDPLNWSQREANTVTFYLPGSPYNQNTIACVKLIIYHNNGPYVGCLISILRVAGTNYEEFYRSPRYVD